MKALYQKLKNEYLSLGGNERWLNRLPKFHSLSAEAKLRQEIRKLKSRVNSIVPNPEKNLEEKHTAAESVKKSSVPIVGLISDYPLKLHEIYLQRRQTFLTACSLKMQLNYYVDDAEQKSLGTQWQIVKLFDVVDAFTTILLHYKETGRILLADVEEDFSSLSPVELLQKRNTLRSNRSNRMKTIAKMEKQLPPKEDKKYLAKFDKLTRKKEELFVLNQRIEKLNQLIDEK